MWLYHNIYLKSEGIYTTINLHGYLLKKFGDNN